MTSINYNSAATTALRTLQQTNSALETSQNRVSTGLKIGEAKDNAAYWSISTTLKSDNKALGTVKDALNLGAATVDTAYQGLNKTLEVLDEIKAKLTASTQDGVNKAAVQAEIGELLKQLTSIATSATFSGENWLSMDSAKSATTASVVSSFTRDASNNISIGSVAVKLADTALIVSNSTNQGILSTERSQVIGGYSIASGAVDLATSQAIIAGDSITFNVTTAAGGTNVVVANATTLANAGLSTIASTADLSKFLNQALSDSKVSGVSVSAESATALKWSSSDTFSVSAATGAGAINAAALTKLGLGAVVTGAAAGATVKSSVLSINISAATKDQIQAYISIVSKASDSVTSAASNLGAVAKRLDLQSTFVDTLIDTIDKGVSGLIDADLSEESTRLQALQTKQQLGIQALSIANTSTQNILSLFRS